MGSIKESNNYINFVTSLIGKNNSINIIHFKSLCL